MQLSFQIYPASKVSKDKRDENIFQHVSPRRVILPIAVDPCERSRKSLAGFMTFRIVPDLWLSEALDGCEIMILRYFVVYSFKKIVLYVAPDIFRIQCNHTTFWIENGKRDERFGLCSLVICLQIFTNNILKASSHYKSMWSIWKNSNYTRYDFELLISNSY